MPASIECNLHDHSPATRLPFPKLVPTTTHAAGLGTQHRLDALGRKPRTRMRAPHSERAESPRARADAMTISF